MNLSDKNKQYKLPDFLIIGAARSGTSSLYFYLRDHPEIFMPELKEPHFFSFLGKASPHPDRPSLSIEDYADLFQPARKGQFIGEASISYLYLFEESIAAIKDTYRAKAKQLNIIAILRNPVDRAWSYYSLRKRGGYKKDFFEMVEELKGQALKRDFHNFVLSGMYSQQVEAYLKNFPNMKIFLFDELQNNPGGLVHEVLEFLKVRQTNYSPPNINKVYNISGEAKNAFWRPLYNILFQKSNLKEIVKPFIPYKLRQRIKTDIGAKIIKKEEMPPDIRQFLAELFEPDLQRLLQSSLCPAKRKIVESWLG